MKREIDLMRESVQTKKTAKIEKKKERKKDKRSAAAVEKKEERI